MPNASNNIELPKFIPDQRIYTLDLTREERFRAREYMQLEKLPDRGHREPSDIELQQAEQAAQPYRDRWREVSSRFDLLADLTRKRVCITVSAGVGKTKLMGQLVALRQAVDPNHLVVLVHFDQLPTETKQFVPFIARQFKKYLSPEQEHQANTLLILGSPVPYVRSLLRNGKLTLAVDGLDEENVKIGKKKAEALRSFLSRFPNCCCCVAGRPYAIVEHYWHELLSTQDSDDDASSEWEFWLVGSFTDRQMKEYLGPEKYKGLQILQADIDFTPRVLESFRTLRSEDVSRIRSVSDVYWFSIDKSLRLDRKPRRAGRLDLDHDEILDFLSACAITLVMWKHDPMCDADRDTGRAGNGQSPVRRLAKLQRFRKLVFDRMKRVYGTDWPVNKKWRSLLKLNSSHVEFEFFLQPEPESLIWRDATDRDFFAGLWMVRSSNQEEREWLAKRQSAVYDVYNSEESQYASQFADLYEVWRFVCGMPDEAMIARDEQDELGRWYDCITPVYETTHVSYRATELMFRSWPNLLRRAGFLRKSAWSEYDLLMATTIAQRYFEPKPDPRLPRVKFEEKDKNASRIVGSFLQQYPLLRDGHDERSRIIAEDLEKWCDCGSRAGMTVQVGHAVESDNVEREEVLPHAFSLCAYQVTNRLYDLFDASHRVRFGKYYREHSPEVRCPANHKTWYDAMMFSIWCGGYLPSEWEWEYASRAEYRNPDGRNSIYYWGDDESRLRGHARVKRNHTRPVGELKANEFGLHDTLGNVYEWCHNRYATERRAWGEDGPSDKESLVFRVLRGGSFSDGVDARCSFRLPNDPSNASLFNGLRVSRARHP